MSDKLRLDYSPRTDYEITPVNAVGATTSTTLRTVTTYDDDNCKHVRKFGIAYEIKQVTDIEDPVDVDMKFWVYALDGTLLGSRVGGGAFVAGTTLTTAQACYLKVTGTGSAIMLTTVLIDTDVDVAGKDFVFPLEQITATSNLDFYLSQTTSTYYDSDLQNGGERHTPDGTSALPYFKIQDALTACGGAFTICTVLDSETYDEALNFDGAWTLQAALGQTPTITCGIGARVTRDVQRIGANANTTYVGQDGNDDTGDGSFKFPFKTLIGLAGQDIKIKDSGTYYLDSDVAGYESIESVYGEIPIIIGTSNLHVVRGISGCIIKKTVIVMDIGFKSNGFHTSDNTFIGASLYADTVTGEYSVLRNIMSGGGIQISNASTGNINKNIIFNASIGIGLYANTAINIDSNICYNNSTGILCSLVGATYSGNIRYNTLSKNLSYGINLIKTSGTFSGNLQENIAWGNGVDVNSGFAITMTYTNYGTKNANVTAGAGCITTDPQFVDSDNNNFALKIGSGAYKTATNETDMGITLGNILVSASNVSINGFNIDGQSRYYYGIYKTGASDYSGLIVKWCNVENFLGYGIDDYSGAVTTGDFQNNVFNNNSYSVSVRRGVSAFAYNIVSNSIVYGMYIDVSFLNFNHNVFFGNGSGVYIKITSLNSVISNSIFSSNGTYGIESGVGITVFNSCINDYVSSLVEYLPEANANITDNPLFVNENEGEEDFHLKSVARGYLFNSPCLEGADDGYDMGAYLETRSVNGGGWKTFQLAHEPSSLNVETVLKDGNVSVSNFGEMFLRGKNFKMIFPLAWSPNQATTEEQSKKIRYFQRLIPTIKNEKKRSECQFRLWFLPDTHLQSGTATIDATLKTITDTSKDWVEDDLSGFWIGVKHSTHASIAVTASTALAVVTGAGWTTNQHQGRYLRINQIPYLILGNTTDTLQLSDPNGYLTSETIAGSIETYYRATGNDENSIEVLDPYSTLPSGSYAYYVAFVTCYISSQGYRYAQPNYAIEKETWKSGYSITFEED